MGMEERLVEESEGSKMGYIWSPWSFDVGDQVLFLPPDSHKEAWEQVKDYYGLTGVVLRRNRGVSTSGIDDEYDIIFKDGTVSATVVESLPSVYLRTVSKV
jgi:hypothetical protein